MSAPANHHAGVISYLFNSKKEALLSSLRKAVSAAVTLGTSWSELDEQDSPGEVIGMRVFDPSTALEYIRKVDVGEDVEVTAVLRQLADMPYWAWASFGCLLLVKGSVSVVRFDNHNLPRELFPGAPLVTLDLDEVGCLALRDICEL